MVQSQRAPPPTLLSLVRRVRSFCRVSKFSLMWLSWSFTFDNTSQKTDPDVAITWV